MYQAYIYTVVVVVVVVVAATAAAAAAATQDTAHAAIDAIMLSSRQ